MPEGPKTNRIIPVVGSNAEKLHTGSFDEVASDGRLSSVPGSPLAGLPRPLCVDYVRGVCQNAVGVESRADAKRGPPKILEGTEKGVPKEGHPKMRV